MLPDSGDFMPLATIELSLKIPSLVKSKARHRYSMSDLPDWQIFDNPFLEVLKLTFTYFGNKNLFATRLVYRREKPNMEKI